MSDVATKKWRSNPQSFWAKVDKSGECWLWLGRRSNEGYGLLGFQGKSGATAHRVAYELSVSGIPKGLVIDHLCRTRHCVNPRHLEVVTQRENILRGIGASAKNAKKTHCPKGHEYSNANTYITPSGSRSCKACNVISVKAYKNRSQS